MTTRTGTRPGGENMAYGMRAYDPSTDDLTQFKVAGTNTTVYVESNLSPIGIPI